MEKDFDEIIEEIRIQEEIRKSDAIVAKLNARIDDLERRYVKQRVDEQTKDSKSRNENYFAAEE